MRFNKYAHSDLIAFWGVALISCLSILYGLNSEQYLAFLVPALAVMAYLALVDFRIIFYLLLFFLPLSIQVTFGTMSTDLPTEPIMVALMFLFFLYYIRYPHVVPDSFFRHPFVVLVALQYLWIFFTMLHAENVVVSVKHFLAKTWYLAVFLLLASVILREVKAVKIFFWCIFIPLTLVAIQMLIRFKSYDFEYEHVNKTINPFFHNKVDFGAMLTSFYPFIWLAATWYPSKSIPHIVLQLAKLFYPVAIYFSYTRMCYLALLAALIAYFIIRYRVMKHVMFLLITAMTLFFGFLLHENRYLRLAPDYEKTIVQDNLEDLIIATIQGEDVSSMERIYRWIAARYMFESRPILGHGPGNFYPYYKRYAVSSFYTYLSDNEERSTVHNYFLLLLVEQGIIGMSIFVVLCILLMVEGENMYYRINMPENKNIIMACMLSLVTAYVNLFFNDMIEVDKTGSLFYMCIAMMVMYDMKDMKEKTSMKAAA